MAQPLVRMEHITKRFGETSVLRDVSFEVAHGEVHALLGGNGAGKSTLMKILMGVYRADEGRILINGDDLTHASINDHMRSGVGMIFQELSLLPNLSVADNIFLGREPLRAGFRLDRRKVLSQTRKLIDDRGFNIRAEARVESLPFAQRQIVEIIKATSLGAKVLVMDEPTSSLTAREEQKLFELIERLTGEGIGIIYISHRIREIFKVADRITVLRDGRTVGPIPIAEANIDKLSEMLARTGGTRRVSKVETRLIDRTAAPALKISGLSTERTLANIGFEVRRGEIVGVAGLVGAGRSTLAKAIAGLIPDARGKLVVAGRTVEFSRAAGLLGTNIGFIPEDRRLEGLILEHGLAANIGLPNLSRLRIGGRFGIIPRRALRKLYADAIRGLSLVAQGPDQPVGDLSGGNQQKVVFAKWLASHPDILVLDEPTAGVDIGAKADMRTVLAITRDRGLGVLLINSELDELVAICDRILVMRKGRLVDEVSPEIGESRLQSLLLDTGTGTAPDLKDAS